MQTCLSVDGLIDMDLRCKGEQLSLECDEDLSRPSSLSWIFGSSNGSLSFVPVENIHSK